MALHKPWEPPFYWPYWAGIYHSGPPFEPWNPAVKHYAVYITDYYGILLLSTFTPCQSLELAIEAAHSLAAMPQVGGQICTSCRGFMFSGLYYRWNIYRGENRLIVPVTEYWGEIPPLPP